MVAIHTKEYGNPREGVPGSVNLYTCVSSASFWAV
uniref:Uncharacterized protein n=1 Tax=Anguilla anguilla TaxID=7936 RepID=A0A0E9S8Z6_ANGAN